MILLLENALLTLPNGQETKKNPPRGGLFSFSDYFPFYVDWNFVEISIFDFVCSRFLFSTHFANPRSSGRSGIPGRCLKNAFLSSTIQY